MSLCYFFLGYFFVCSFQNPCGPILLYCLGMLNYFVFFFVFERRSTLAAPLHEIVVLHILHLYMLVVILYIVPV